MKPQSYLTLFGIAALVLSPVQALPIDTVPSNSPAQQCSDCESSQSTGDFEGGETRAYYGKQRVTRTRTYYRTQNAQPTANGDDGDETPVAATTTVASTSAQSQDRPTRQTATASAGDAITTSASSGSTSNSSAKPAASNTVGKVSTSDPHELLKLHNDYRAQHNAPPMTWNDELQGFATQWGLQCTHTHSGNGKWGENLAAGTGGYGETQALFTSWTDESKDYDPSNPTYSHFTQVVWKKSTKLGCALITCPPGTIFDAQYGEAQYLVCEYDPPGNYAGQFGENVE